MHRTASVRIWLACAFALVGCSEKASPVSEPPRPLPVSVLTLRETVPDTSSRMPGVIGSWKTENIGFQVAGRVQYVIEPETDIEGHVLDADGKVLVKGTMLARLEDERYRLNVQRAEADIRSTESQRDAMAIEIDRVIPARQKAAEVELNLAKNEHNRVSGLFKQGAGTQDQLDKSQANLDTAAAQLAQVIASKESKQAEQSALEARIEQLRSTLREAQRDLEDCRLVSSFEGQVAKVYVIPGGYVERGEPVLTVQMMNPIKVELEVSAEAARRLHYKDTVQVWLSQPDGSEAAGKAVVYMTDPVADPETRTFTATLLMANEKVRAAIPDELTGKPIARTRDVWRFYPGLAGKEDKRFVDVNTICRDDDGAYVWKVLNPEARTAGTAAAVLKVRKVRVIPGELRVPFLGIWVFQEITVAPDEDFDVENDIIAGALDIPKDESAKWDGETVLFERNQWLLRPGDLVRVNLANTEARAGFYVPIAAISEEPGSHSVYSVATDPAGEAKAERRKVKVFDGPGTLKRIESADDRPLSDGMQVVVGGVYYLHDGDSVRVIKEEEVSR